MSFTHVSVTERRTLPPALAVSTVAFAIRPPLDARIGDPADNPARDRAVDRAHDAASELTDTVLWIPLVRRTRHPYLGRWALPGSPILWNETLTDTALRTVHDAVLRAPGYLEQLYAFGAVERSADAQRLVTIAYWAQYGERDLDAPPSVPQTKTEAPPAVPNRSGPRRWDDVDEAPTSLAAPTLVTTSVTPDAEPEAVQTIGQPAAVADPSAGPDPNVAWFPAHRLPPLAFDHTEIVTYALTRLRSKTEYSQVAYRFLGDQFTLSQLRRVHEAILGHAVDPANFRRDTLASGSLVDTGERLTGTAHRPARLYRFRGSRDAELSTEPTAASVGAERTDPRSRP